MPHSKLSVALAALLTATLAMPAFARSGGGGGGGHSGGHGAHSSSGGRAHSHTAGSGPRRGFFFRHRIGFFIGASVFAWSYYYPVLLTPMPPIEYIEKPPEGTWYFCPEANGYYPAVEQCPSGWVQAQPLWAWPPPVPDSAPNPFEGAWSPLGPRD